jgi:hypothetical protein
MRHAVLVALVALLAGCAAALPPIPGPPTPGAPAIHGLVIVPVRPALDCPVTIRFQFDAPEADITGGTARWWWRFSRFRGAGAAVLAIDRAVLAGKRGGEIVVSLIPPDSGSYRYDIWIEDAAGRTSNVLEGRLDVPLPPLWAKRECSKPGRSRDNVQSP